MPGSSSQNGVVTVRNATKATVLGERIGEARSFFSRGRGLMFVRSLERGEGLVIDPCSSIHTFFMRIPIDVVYVDREGLVVRVDAEMPPWRIGPVFTGAKWVVELPGGTIAQTGTTVGDRIEIDP